MGVRDGRAHRCAQVDVEVLRQFLHLVIGHVQRDGLRSDASRKVQVARQRAGARRVVARGDRAVGRHVVVHRRGLVGQARLGHREGDRAVGFAHRHVVDRERRQRVVVGDRAHTLCVRDGGVHRCKQVDVEVFRQLVHRVVGHVQRDGLCRHIGRKVQRARQQAGARRVVARGERRVWRHREVHRGGQRRQARLGHREGDRAVGFAYRHVVDRERRCWVIVHNCPSGRATSRG